MQRLMPNDTALVDRFTLTIKYIGKSGSGIRLLVLPGTDVMGGVHKSIELDGWG